MAAEMLRKSYDEAVGREGREVTTRLALVMSFVQGIWLCETAILSGLYVQAATLARQEIETVAALEEALIGARTDGKTPNVRHVPPGLRREYGYLSRLAHVSNLDAHGPLLEEAADGPSRSLTSLPEYRPALVQYLFSIHVTLVLRMILLMNETYRNAYGAGFSSDELVLSDSLLVSLVEDGVVTLESERCNPSASCPTSAPAPEQNKVG